MIDQFMRDKEDQFAVAFERMAAPYLTETPYRPNDIDRAELHRVIREGSLKGKRLGAVMPPVIRKLHEAKSTISWYAVLQCLLGHKRTKWGDVKRSKTDPKDIAPVEQHESYQGVNALDELRAIGFSESEIQAALCKPSRFMEERRAGNDDPLGIKEALQKRRGE